MKKIVSVLLCAVIIAAVVPSWAFAVTSGTIGKEGNITWSFKDDVLTISGSGYMSTDTNDYMTNGIPVWGNLNFTSVIVEEGVLSINNYAFKCSKYLETISLPASLERIGAYVFLECTSLKEIKLAEGNQHFTLKHGVLFNKDCTDIILYPPARQGTEYSIPEGVTCIGIAAFAHCSNLENVVIPATVKTIDKGAFSCCKKIQEFVIPDSVTCIMDSAFDDCSSLRSINIPAGVKKIINCTFGFDTALERIIIEGKIEEICDQAFYETPNLKDVYFVGSQADREKIDIGYDNSSVKSATWHYNTDISAIPPLQPKEPEIKDDILIYLYHEGYMTYYYKTTVRLRADVADDVSVIWYVNGESVSNKKTVEIKEATNDFTVEIVATQKNGVQTKQIQEYKIKHGFFDKLYWFIMHYIFPENFIVDNTKDM